MRITELGIVSRQICINLFIYLYMYLLVYGIRTSIYIYEYVYMVYEYVGVYRQQLVGCCFIYLQCN